MSETTVPTRKVCIVIFDEERDRILLHRRGNSRFWVLPGGQVGSEETLEEAAIRETLQETGYEIVPQRVVGEYWNPHQGKSGNLETVFKGTVMGSESDQLGSEALGVAWFHIQDLPRMTRTTRMYIMDMLANSPQPLRRTVRLSPLERFIQRFIFSS